MARNSEGLPSSLSGVVDIVMKVLSGLVIPLIFWGVRLEVTNALQDERIAEMQTDLTKFSNITSQVQNITVALVRLEERIANVDAKIRDVEGLLRNAS